MDTFDQIFQEYHHSLLLYSLKFIENENDAHDIVRLERVEEAAQDRHEWELPILSPPTKEDYFAPIPISEILINPKLD